MTSSAVWLFRDHLVYATSDLKLSHSDSPVYELLITGPTGSLRKDAEDIDSSSLFKIYAPGEWPGFRARLLVDVMVYPGTALSHACRSYLEGRSEAELPEQHCATIANQAAALATGNMRTESVLALTAGLRQYLAESSTTPTMDTRVQELANSLSEAPFRRLRLAHSAKSLGVSADYLRHQFATQIGISPRRYVSFWRIIRAAEAMVSVKIPGGRLVTNLVVEGGYTDNSHLNKVFNKYFGGTAKSLFSNSPIVIDGRCSQPTV